MPPYTAAQLHQELADFYRDFRYRSAPANLYTESLWDAILLLEEMEAES